MEWGNQEEEELWWFMSQNPNIVPSSSTSPENNRRHVAASPENHIHGNPFFGNRLYQNPRVQNHHNQNPITPNYFYQNPTTQNIYFQNPTSEEYCGGDPFLPGDYFGQNPMNLHEQASLEASLRRLNLSTPSHQPLGNGGGGGSMMGRLGFSPSTYEQNLLMLRNQQHYLEMMRIQSAVRGQMGNYMSSTSHGATSLSSNNYSSSSSFANSQLRNYPIRAPSSDGFLHKKFPKAKDDQCSSRFLQKKFEAWMPDQEITEMDGLHKLMVDDHGQCKIQKILEESNEEQITEILLTLISNEQKLKRICTDNHGSRSMQKVMEYLKTPEQISLLISAIRNMTLALTKSSGGQYLLQRCFRLFSEEYNKVSDCESLSLSLQHIVNEVVENCVDISTDKAGCCTMYKCVDYADGETRERLVAKITANALLLSKHPYGNFVVQHILELRIPHVLADIVARLKGSFLSLAMDKFGSHVVEKCMRESGGEHSTRIIKELISSPKLFLNFLQDKYGNYVAQSALAISKGAIHEALVRLIEHHSIFLESHPCGKMVLARARGNKRRE